MGRKSKPIKDTGPIGQFAQRLRDRQDAVRPRPALRVMAQDVFCSHSVLADACAGKKLPTEDVVVAFVTALGADPEEIEQWKADRLQVAKVVGRLRRKLGDADVVVPTHSPTGKPIRPGRLRPVQVELAAPDACVPDPDAAQTFEDLKYGLRVLRIAVGNPSLRVLAAHMDKMDFVDRMGVSTLGDLFNGKRTPTYDTFDATVRGLIDFGLVNHRFRGKTQADRPAWARTAPWMEAWRRAEYNRVRPDRMRRTGNNNLYLMSGDQDISPTTSVFAAMNPPVAAALLIGMAPEETARVLEDLPTDKSRALIREMEKLAGKAAVDAEGAITKADVDRLADAVGDGTVVAMNADRRRQPGGPGPGR
ncbi:helix-turn-helix domain-containing protein [Amycolatopsis sp. cmx-4-61]|uniref:helix-turn-helix domain-containing protein n=1 Tax=Amycolatopsis sp. cmx-4-61 TaxID=2790937 RepID=UPI00397BDB47